MKAAYAIAAWVIVFGCGVSVGVSVGVTGDLWWYVLRAATCQ